MNERERIKDELRRSYQADPWHGPAVTRLLDGVDATAAAAHPISGAHSIWEIVLHLTSWTDEGMRRLEGHTPNEPLDGDWPPVGEATPERWDAARAQLSVTTDALIDAIDDAPDTRMDEIVDTTDDTAPGTGVPVAVMLHGLAQHHAYHGGQIALLKRALNLDL